MDINNILIILVVLSACFLPAVSFYYDWKLGRDWEKKKRKMAEFIEKAADDQIKASSNKDIT